MSVSASPDNSGISQLVDALSQLVESARFENAVSALIAYEYVITIDQEVVLFWNRKKTGASWLFFAIRYLALLTYAILGPASFAPLSDDLPARTARRISRADNPISVLGGIRRASSPRPHGYEQVACRCHIHLVLRSFRPQCMDRFAGFRQRQRSARRMRRRSYLRAHTDSGRPQHGHHPLVQRNRRPHSDRRHLAVRTQNGRYALRARDNPAPRARPRCQRCHILLRHRYPQPRPTHPIDCPLLPHPTACRHHPLHRPVSPLPARASPHIQPHRPTYSLTAMICRFMLALQAANQRAIAARAFDDTSAPLDGEDDIAQVGGSLRFASVVIGSVGASIPMVDPDASLFQSDDEHEEAQTAYRGQLGNLAYISNPQPIIRGADVNALACRGHEFARKCPAQKCTARYGQPPRHLRLVMLQVTTRASAVALTRLTFNGIYRRELETQHAGGWGACPRSQRIQSLGSGAAMLGIPGFAALRSTTQQPAVFRTIGLDAPHYRCRSIWG